MNNKSLKKITKNIDYDSNMATIKLLLATAEPNFKEEHLNSLVEVISWNMTLNDLKDYKFLSKLISKTEKKIQKYFDKKHLNL